MSWQDAPIFYLYMKLVVLAAFGKVNQTFVVETCLEYKHESAIVKLDVFNFESIDFVTKKKTIFDLFFKNRFF